MPRVLSLSEQLEELYSVSIDGQRYSETNSIDIEKMKGMVLKAMNQALTERQRSCLYMYYFDGMTMKQIAQSLGVHPSTVTRHLQAAMVKLKKLRAFV